MIDQAERDMMAARGFYTGAEALARFGDNTEAAAKAGHEIYCYEVMIETGSQECRCDPKGDDEE